jgi:transcriptional antiterminator RfaH
MAGLFHPLFSDACKEKFVSHSSMNDKWSHDDIRWYVVHTHPKQEDRADSNLRVLGVRTFNPKMRGCRYNHYTNTLTHLVKPLFPRYIFAQFEISDLYHKVRFTRGIHSLVSFGSSPIPIDEAIVAMIQSRMEEDGCVAMHEHFNPGDKVVIKDGPLRNLAGIFERELNDADRVRILLQTVSYQAHVEIEKDLVAKIKGAK